MSLLVNKISILLLKYLFKIAGSNGTGKYLLLKNLVRCTVPSSSVSGQHYIDHFLTKNAPVPATNFPFLFSFLLFLHFAVQVFVFDEERRECRILFELPISSKCASSFEYA